MPKGLCVCVFFVFGFGFGFVVSADMLYYLLATVRCRLWILFNVLSEAEGGRGRAEILAL